MREEKSVACPSAGLSGVVERPFLLLFLFGYLVVWGRVSEVDGYVEGEGRSRDGYLFRGVKGRGI